MTVPHRASLCYPLDPLSFPVLEVQLRLQKEHPSRHAGLVGCDDVADRAVLDPPDFANDAQSAVFQRVPIESGTDLVRVSELAEHVRGPRVHLSLGEEEVPDRRLEAMVKSRAN